VEGPHKRGGSALSTRRDLTAASEFPGIYLFTGVAMGGGVESQKEILLSGFSPEPQGQLGTQTICKTASAD
jgi:hypothetical protein